MTTPSAPSPAVPLPAEIGEIVGGYRLDSVIGRGGMGCVYAATHARLGRRAAIKVLSAALAHDVAYVERFFNEARVVNSVRHPNIVDVFDFVEIDEPRRVAYVMELLEGPTLAAVLAQRRLSVVQMTNIALQLVGVLEAVHQIGVVHRDLKPDNLVVLQPLDSDFSAVPSIKVLDFGIAKISDPTRASSTMPGSIMGTPAYMAPEQISGTSVSPAADIYALGALIYEMLTGRRLFPGEVMTVFKEKLLGRPATMTLPDTVHAPELVRELVALCVSPDPKMRPELIEVRERLIDIRRLHTDEALPAALGAQSNRKVPAQAFTLSPPAIELEPTLAPTMFNASRRRERRLGLVLVMIVLAFAAAAAGVFAMRASAPAELAAPALPPPPMPAASAAPPRLEPVKLEAAVPEPPAELDAEPVKKKLPKQATKKKTAPIKRDDMKPW